MRGQFLCQVQPIAAFSRDDFSGLRLGREKGTAQGSNRRQEAYADQEYPERVPDEPPAHESKLLNFSERDPRLMDHS